MSRCHKAIGIPEILGRRGKTQKAVGVKGKQRCVREINLLLRREKKNMLNYFVLHFIEMYMS